MMEINGKKYISEEEFDEAVVGCLRDIHDTCDEVNKKANANAANSAMLFLLIAGEYARLGVELFEDKKEDK